MILVAIFFVSGADAASIVMGTLSERGSQRAAAADGRLLGRRDRRRGRGDAAGRRPNALTGLQTITIVAALPFVVVMIGAVPCPW